MPRPILVSACLLGLCTRYDGTAKSNAGVLDYLHTANRLPIPICPEQLSGLPTPRPPARFATGDGAAVLDGQGLLISAEEKVLNDLFLRGARETLKIARLTGCQEALLKERSPSCGVRQVTRGGEVVSGQGVTAALLARNDMQLYSEEEVHSLPIAG